MATRIRLQRHGRKSRPIFHIVVADSRAKRDGRFIEALGVYNPNTNPATIDINFERALEWMMTGAEPSDTARAILSHKGILMKKHLLEGVKKGALTLEQVEERFEKWLNEKQALVDNKVTSLMTSAQKNKADRLKAETESNTKKAAAIASKLALISSAALETAEAAAAEASAEAAPEVAAEAAPEVAAEAAPEVAAEAAPEVVAETAPEVAAEAAPEVAAEAAPEVAAEVAAEAAPEVAAEAAPEVAAEAAPEVVAEVAAETAPEVVAEVAAEAAPEVVAEAAPEAEAPAATESDDSAAVTE